MSEYRPCSYVSEDKQKCKEKDLGTGFCFWHDPIIDKTGMELSERLEAFASSGGLLQGIRLKRANLFHVNLVRPDSPIGYDMRSADLYRANMQEAHLFNLDLSGASLMKANLNEANLHCANLHNCNLLGTKLHGARLDNIKIGDFVQQEAIADSFDKKGLREEAADHYEQSEEIYRNLRKSAESDGLLGLAGHCAHKELTMRRKQFPKFSKGRIISKTVDLFCGYGERPMNVISFSLALIFVCALLFFIFGVQANEGIIKFSTENSLASNLSDFFSTIYFSVVTFTTLGYGDIQPVGFSRLIAAVEAFIGSFALALFVVVFVKKTTR
ncbi:pentapeptide repeat-containing protein [Psychrosphaera sp. B3R10]|uniref:ion channel n=1 Tax=unclassified Psychrosphaera TaxID=2641570 RepID=UPI001C09DB8F|nr:MULTISPECIES: pentapeptide repeat-containing protein [unclassified Psychrosphaera]MBU2882228.1 pentapeptide repeat-containing protein [Psychrosphaera sp. I2R16]MBU2988909.1 pentapeptide repeat-containing protein [Psychrosphaera sp. B3R10]MDO6717929.1 pentapeptide repeat-containing protein [Psychrosphaera sp. 1_MG-2023]